MGSVYLTELGNWCREAGLLTHEDAGWQHRARSSGGYEPGRPICIMWHHTASQTTPVNDVNYICRGSGDAPLANLLLARNGEVWVCAGGATNTNGKGGPISVSRGTVPKDSMNTYGLGIEAANNGVGEPWPQAQIDAYFALNNVLADRLGLAVSDLCEHAIYAPDRKIDPAVAESVQGPWRPGRINASGTWNQSDVVAEALRRSTPLPPPPEDDMAEIVEIQVEGADAVFLGHVAKVGAVTGILWCEWVNGSDDMQISRLLAYRDLNARVMRLAPDNFHGIGLIGPVPSGDPKRNWQRSDFGNVI